MMSGADVVGALAASGTVPRSGMPTKTRDDREVLSRPEHGVTIAELFAFKLRGRRELAEHVETCLDDLPQHWRESVARRLPGEWKTAP